MAGCSLVSKSFMEVSRMNSHTQLEEKKILPEKTPCKGLHEGTVNQTCTYYYHASLCFLL